MTVAIAPGGQVWTPSGGGTWELGGGGGPSAPTNVTAYATVEGAYVLFAPPSNAGFSALTQYTATWSNGGSGQTIVQTVTDNALNANVLNCRVDINNLPAGVAGTITVFAVNSTEGAGPQSIASNSVTPLAYPSGGSPTPWAGLFVADGGNFTAENPAWGDYSYGGTGIFYGVTPGTASHNGAYAPGAPSNPIDPSLNVIEFDNANGGTGAMQPHIFHEHPGGSNNGRLNLNPYGNFVVSVFPTAATAGLNIYFLQCEWVNGVAFAGSGNGVLVDTTQSWQVNMFANAAIWNLTSGNVASVISNTATSIVFAGFSFSVGDYYEISVPDVPVGNSIVVGNGSSNPSWGPATLTIGAWNNYTIPLSAFGSFPNNQILKFACGLSGTNPVAEYFCNVGFK